MAEKLNMYRKMILKALPKHWRGKLLREQININYEVPEGVTFQVATSQEELEQAFHLLHDAYVAVGLMKPEPSGLRVSVYHALPTTIVITASKEGKVLGTATIIRDTSIGLPSEKAINLDEIRKPGVQIAEISALAILPNWRGRIFFPLLKFIYELSIKYFKIDLFVASVHNDWHFFYEAILLFERIQDRTITNYAFANFVPIVGEFIDLRRGYFMYAEKYAHLTQDKNLFRYFCDHSVKEFIWPKTRFFSIINPGVNLQTIDYFFNQKTDTFSRISEKEYWALTNIYSEFGIENIIAKPKGNIPSKKYFRRNSVRMPTCLNATIVDISGNLSEVIVQEVSRSKIKIKIHETKLSINTNLSIKIQVGPFDVAEVLTKPVAKVQDQVVLEVVSSCKNWIEYTEWSLNILGSLSSGFAA